MIELVQGKIDLDRVIAAVSHPGAGATVIFVGTTRDHNEGREVIRLEYEAYEEMAISELQRLVLAAQAQWPETRAAIAHRLGEVPLSEPSVVIAVSSPHRAQAFAACRFLIDELKKSVPIWKKEFFQGGEVWIGTQQGTPLPSSWVRPDS